MCYFWELESDECVTSRGGHMNMSNLSQIYITPLNCVMNLIITNINLYAIIRDFITTIANAYRFHADT